MLDSARAGEGRLVVVEGTAGIGKTRLLGAARELAHARELEVLTARGGELEGEFAFGVVRQLFEAPLAAATPDLRAELLAGAAELSSSLFTSAPTDMVARGGGVVVRDAARPLLGRCQFRSPPTRRCWSSTTCTGQTSPRCAGFSTSHTGSKACRSCSWLGRDHRSRPTRLRLSPSCSPTRPAVVIRPGSLGLARSAAALARARLGDEPESGFHGRAGTGSGGNPLYLVALLDAVRQQGLAPTAEHAPHVLAARAAVPFSYGVATRLTPPTERGCRLCSGQRRSSVIKRSSRSPLRSRDSSTTAALDAASALVRADLLRHETPVEFMHPVVRTAVLEDMTAAERVGGHRRAAEVLLDTGALARASRGAPRADASRPRSVRRRDASTGGGALTRPGCSGSRRRIPAPRSRGATSTRTSAWTCCTSSVSPSSTATLPRHPSICAKRSAGSRTLPNGRISCLPTHTP